VRPTEHAKALARTLFGNVVIAIDNPLKRVNQAVLDKHHLDEREYRRGAN
jgi:hypothetical protein